MLLDHDLESMGISVIPCGGKSNLDRAAAIFLNLAIPTYVVWDGDRQLTSRTDQDRAIQENRRLMMLMGRPAEDWPEAVTAHFACFATTMDKTLKQEIGEAEYTRLFQECVDEFGYSRVEYAKKNPIVIATCLQRAKEAGRKSVTLEKIIMKILELHRSSQIEDERHMPILSDVVEMENDDALVMPREPVTVQADVL